MSNRPRFTIELTIRDNYGPDTYHHAMGCDDALRVSSRAVEEIKIGLSTMDDTVRMMRVREMRRDILMQAAKLLAGQMADRMQDAEGWHDTSRIEPARKSLGGRWGN